MVTVILSKTEAEETSMLEGIIKSVPDELISAEEEEVTREEVLPKVFRFIRRWHLSIRENNPMVTDHVLHRVIAGIFVPGVDDAPLNPSQLMQIVFNEIVSEYSCFTSMEACSEALLKFERDLPNEEKLFSSIEDRASGKESSELKIDPSLIVFYQNPATETSTFPYCVKLETLSEMASIMNNNYHLIKGKAYNNRLVFSSNFTRMVSAVIRAFTRFGNACVVGPRGCGKTSVISYCAQVT